MWLMSQVIHLGREGMRRWLPHCICREQWTLALITLYLLFIFIQFRTPIHRVPTFRMGPSLAKQISLKTPFPAYAETCVLGDSRSRWVASEDIASQLFYQKEKFNLQKREGKERYLLS